MNRFGNLTRPSTVHRCEAALARSQYPKIDDVLELMDGDDDSKALAIKAPAPKRENPDG